MKYEEPPKNLDSWGKLAYNFAWAWQQYREDADAESKREEGREP